MRHYSSEGYLSGLAVTIVFGAFGVLLPSSGCSSGEGASALPDAGPDRVIITIPKPDDRPWTPENLSPALWLDGDDAIDWHGIVTQWPDRSRNGNDAAQPVSVEPKIVSDFNGHKAVSFEGTSRLDIKDAPSLQWGMDDFAFFTVVRFRGARDVWVGDLYVKDKGPEPFPGVHMLITSAGEPDGGGTKPSQFWMGTGSGTRVISAKNEGYADNRPHVTSFRRRGDELELRVDFRVTAVMTTPRIDVSAEGVDARIGGQPGDQFLDGDIACLIGVHRTVSDEDVGRTEAYFKERYGL